MLRDRFDKASVNYAVKLPQAISAQEIWMLNEIFDENGPFSKVNRNQVWLLIMYNSRKMSHGKNCTLGNEHFGTLYLSKISPFWLDGFSSDFYYLSISVQIFERFEGSRGCLIQFVAHRKD